MKNNANNKKTNLFVRILAIALAGLMIASVATVLISLIFAAF